MGTSGRDPRRGVERCWLFHGDLPGCPSRRPRVIAGGGDPRRRGAMGAVPSRGAAGAPAEPTFLVRDSNDRLHAAVRLGLRHDRRWPDLSHRDPRYLHLFAGLRLFPTRVRGGAFLGAVRVDPGDLDAPAPAVPLCRGELMLVAVERKRVRRKAANSDVPAWARRGGWWWGLSRWTKWVVLLAGAVIIILPFLWMLGASFKPESDIFGYPLRLQPTHPTFANYVGIWHELPFFRLLVNSVVFAGGVTVCSVFFDSLA